MSRLNGKVAFISGVARGQGRTHALRLASEGAKIVGFDLCAQIDSVAYPLATLGDLEETIKLVEAAGGQMIGEVADVRDPDQVQRVATRALDEFHHIDIVLANAGIMPVIGGAATGFQAWKDATDVMLTGVFNTVEAAIPSMIERNQGGSIVITSSTAGLKGMASRDPGALGYVAAKHGVVGLMKSYANLLGQYFIRVNTVHPTGTNTPMVANEQFMEFIIANPALAESMQNVIPVAMVEPEDISNAVAWLASDEAQYVTGVTLSVDAGFNVR